MIPCSRSIYLILFLALNSLYGSRVIVKVWEGDFVQEYQIVEQGKVWRIDAPTKNWSIIYHSETGSYTGIEHRDAAYWGFRWDDVQKALQNSKHHFRRFSDLNIEGFASYDLTRPMEAPTEKEEWKVQSIKGDEIWEGFPSHSWLLSTTKKNDIHARTVSTAFLHNFFGRFSVIHDQIRQAVIRSLWPEWVEEASLELKKETETPVEMKWGSEKNPYYWKVVHFEEKTEEPPSFFEVPSKYHATTVESLRGILEEVEAKP
ncbi:MAG: hypothetical protein V4507_00895 [Verrucomicrobiota bacterium]